MQQVARRLHLLQQIVGQTPLESALHPQQQLHPRQTIEAQIAVERAVEFHRSRVCPGAVQLAVKRAHDVQQTLRQIGAVRRRPLAILTACRFHVRLPLTRVRPAGAAGFASRSIMGDGCWIGCVQKSAVP
jgi:hypothetical protein